MKIDCKLLIQSFRSGHLAVIYYFSHQPLPQAKIKTMSDSSAKQIQMLNEYVAALERQIKSIQTQRQSLFQQITKTQQAGKKSDQQLRALKNQLRQQSTLLYNLAIDKTNMQNEIRHLAQNNSKLKKQLQFAEKKISQMNTALNEKTDLLAKEKNNLYMTTTYHNKQMHEVQERAKQLERKLNDTLEEKIFINMKLAQVEEFLVKEKQINADNTTKISFCNKQIEALEFKAAAFEHDLKQLSQQKQTLKAKLSQTSLSLQTSRKQAQNMCQKLLSGNQSNQQTRKSYQALIENITSKYEQQVSEKVAMISSRDQSIKNLKEIIEKQEEGLEGLRRIIDVKNGEIVKFNKILKEKEQEILVSNQKINGQNDMIESIMNELSQEKDNFIKEFEKTTKLSEEIVQMNLKIQDLKNQMSQQILNKNLSLQDKQKAYLDLIQKLSEAQAMYHHKTHESQQRSKELQLKTKEFQIKTKECHSLNLKISEIMIQVQEYRKSIEIIGSQKAQQSQRLKHKIQIMDDQLVQLRKKQAKISKNLKETQEKLTKSTDQLLALKQSSDKVSTEQRKRINELQKQLQLTKDKLQLKQQNLQGLGSETQFKIKQFANKQQQTTKQLTELQAKYRKITTRLAQTEKQLDLKDTQYNRKIQKLIVQHKNELKDTKKLSQEQTKSLSLKYQQQLTSLNLKLNHKSKQLKQTESQLFCLKQDTRSKISSKMSSMEKKNSMLQLQLQDTKKQLCISHQNIAGLQGNVKKLKQEILQREIRIQGLNIQLSKAKKDQQWLVKESEIMRQQIQALEHSTLYLKKQITSTLDQQQKSLKQIRSLKETNREISKLLSGAVPLKRSRQRAQTCVIIEGHNSGLGNMESNLRKSELINTDVNLLLEKRLYGSSYKRSSKVIPKFSTESSVPSSDNAQIISEQKEQESNKETLVARNSFQEGEFMPPSIVSSSYYSHQDKQQH